MTKQLPPPRAERLLIPAFTPVPRRYRHDGWTPERQKAFIGALADTGCVDRAARMVNIAQTNCYTLRRAPGAEEFRRAWDAARSRARARHPRTFRTFGVPPGPAIRSRLTAPTGANPQAARA